MSIEWNGVGLPPVGIEVRVKSPGYNHPRFDKFIGLRVTIVAHDLIDGDEVAVFRRKVDDFSEDFEYHAMAGYCFESLKNQSERKRSAICDSIYGAMSKAERKDNRSDMAEAIYDAIAAGEIPHITLK